MAEEEGSQIATAKKFIVIGLLTSEDFQKCRHALTKLHKSFPKEFAVPDIRPLLDVEWNEFITKERHNSILYNKHIMQRQKLGNGLWSIKNKVAVFKDGEFLGDFDGLFEFIWKERRFVLNEDWYSLACRHLMEYLDDKTDHYRQLVYLTIAIDNQVIGSLLFQLYNDIVPLASENFLNRCKNEINGYLGAPVHREWHKTNQRNETTFWKYIVIISKKGHDLSLTIAPDGFIFFSQKFVTYESRQIDIKLGVLSKIRIVKNSWIQCGGYELEPQKMPCENYVVSHDRRGVLSMCNNGPHRDNSTQFYITLDSAPWMNYKYVAFGQLLQGDDVLKAIANIPTYYQAPTCAITIVKCGEFKTRLTQTDSSTFLFQPDEIDQWKQIQDQMDILTYLKQCYTVMDSEGHDLYDYYNRAPAVVESCDSVLSPNKMQFGNYSLKSDLRSYGPFSHLPDVGSASDEGDEDYNICEPSFSLMRYRKKLLYDDNASPATSDMTV